jgi:hypothetical protein
LNVVGLDNRKLGVFQLKSVQHRACAAKDLRSCDAGIWPLLDANVDGHV